MRIPPFAIVVILCGAVIAATQIFAQRSDTTAQISQQAEEYLQ